MRIWGLSPLWLSPFQDFSPQIPCALTAQILTSPPYCDFWGASKCLIPQLSHNLSRKANKCGLCPKVLNSFQFLPAFRYSIAFNELFLNFVQNLFRHYQNSKNVFSSNFIMFSVSVENINLLDFLGILSHHLQLNIICSTFLILIPILLSHLTVQLEPTKQYWIMVIKQVYLICV